MSLRLPNPDCCYADDIRHLCDRCAAVFNQRLVLNDDDDEELDDEILEELEEAFDEETDDDFDDDDSDDEDLLVPGAVPVLQERVANRAKQLADIKPTASLPLPVMNWEPEAKPTLVANYDFIPQNAMHSPHASALPNVLNSFVGNTGEAARELLPLPTLDFSGALQRPNY
jgi:hypothetical protein